MGVSTVLQYYNFQIRKSADRSIYLLSIARNEHSFTKTTGFRQGKMRIRWREIELYS